jgi:hypothetical protein
MTPGIVSNRHDRNPVAPVIGSNRHDRNPLTLGIPDDASQYNSHAFFHLYP